MQSYAQNKSNFVYVRHKRTRSVDIRRADEFRPQSSSSLLSQERALHFVGADRISVCRCSNPGRHGERISSVASESRHLAAGLRLYLDRHNLGSCAIAEFREYIRGREAEWAKEGVYVDDFHYTSRDKNVVCRCSQSREHSYRAPRNPEIVEQCAAFFYLHKGKTTVSKDQWKGVDGDTPPSYSASVDIAPGHNPHSRSSSSRYDEERVQSRSSLETRMRDTAERIASIIPGRRRAWTSEPQSDMPPQVWQSARVSALTPRPGTSSLDSTPLGSASPSTRASSPAVSYTRSDRVDSVLNASSIYARAKAMDVGVFPGSYPDPRTSKAGATTAVHSPYTNNRNPPTDANASVLYKKENNETSGSSRSPPFRYDEWFQTRLPNQTLEEENDELSLPSFHVERYMSVLFGIDNHPMAARTPVAELPARRSPVELPAMRARQRNKETLKKLEGRVYDTRSELEAKRYSVRCTRAPTSTSDAIHKTAQLSSRFEQVSELTSPSLPNQEEFLLRYGMPSSRIDPARAGNCQLCSKSYHNAQKHPIIVPDCGCSMHEPCLLEDLRKLDDQFGRCPICHAFLCRRTLTDRIGTDIELIFESQVTPLRKEISIEFPERSQLVTCSTEEGVAVAHLRLIKDYVDVHTEEVFRLWEGNRAEPDWYAGVVRPVVQLFQGWNPSVRSRFFVNQDAFLKLIVWSELARLMNISCERTRQTQGSDAQFPRLGRLHRKFTMAIERYNKEKRSWDTSRSGVFEHDRIAIDVINIAIATDKP